MKKHKMVVSVVALLVALAALAAAQATFTKVTGTEIPVAIPNPGEVVCHGAQPTGNPFAPCPAGITGTVRGRQMVAQETTSDPKLTGLNHVIANSNIHADGSMNIWGTFRLEVVGGTWEGVWEGKQEADGSSSYSATGHGSGGSIEGLQLLWDGTYPPGSPIANITARILAPGK